LICLIVPGSGCGDGVELTEPEMDFAGSEFIQREHSGPGTESPDLTGDGSESQPLPEGSLRFTLQKGDHFPLRKHVTQTLVQNLPGGEVTSRSDLKLMFAITVDGEDKGRRQLGVRYQRVQYSLELPGQRTKYDSKSPPEFVPDSLQMYHGLANNGFDFWIGADNRIVHLDGFQDFLKRCVRFAPPERQHEPVALQPGRGWPRDDGPSQRQLVPQSRPARAAAHADSHNVHVDRSDRAPGSHCRPGNNRANHRNTTESRGAGFV
jgi:hypothetical protein